MTFDKYISGACDVSIFYEYFVLVGSVMYCVATVVADNILFGQKSREVLTAKTLTRYKIKHLVS